MFTFVQNECSRSTEYAIAKILSKKYNLKAVVVSYEQSGAHEKIQDFQNSDNDWIIAIGMVSEGTDIPRLQVCAYLSHVRTELYFRQVLGRILRVNESADEPCYLFAFAESRLIKYSKRISIDLPEESMEIKHLEGFGISTGTGHGAHADSLGFPTDASGDSNSNIDSDSGDGIGSGWVDAMQPLRTAFCRDSYRSLIMSL